MIKITTNYRSPIVGASHQTWGCGLRLVGPTGDPWTHLTTWHLWFYTVTGKAYFIRFVFGERGLRHE